jgi:hypothetical protein
MGCFASKSSSVEEGPRPTAADKDLNPQSFPDEEDGEDLVFFDAFSSFTSVVSNMSYAPTSTMIAGGGRASMAIPKTMLLPTTATNAVAHTNDKKNTAGALSESVVGITQKLGGGSMAIQGYPGQLNQVELQACLNFRDELKKRDSAFHEMVHAYSPAEDEAFALCRFLRAREFNVDEIFAMLEGNHAIDVWKQAREKNYYRDLEQLYHGCPLPVLMKLFPVVISGLAKNGATMFYFKPGGMNIEALECVSDLPQLVPYLWNMLHLGGIASMQREVNKHGPESTVLSERIIVVDMKNISSALFNTEFMKEAAKITACFPETMNRTYMLNVPTAFTMVWAVAKLFLEARTINKIGFFARETRAKEDLLTFVDSNELLSDYGGTGPSFQHVLQERQAEAGSCSRWIVECVTTTQRDPHFSFDLAPSESLSSITVFSKGNHGAQVTVSNKDDGTVVIPATHVKRKDGGENSHYSVVMDSSKFLHAGTGPFQVQVDGVAKENYLLVIGVKAR